MEKLFLSNVPLDSLPQVGMWYGYVEDFTLNSDLEEVSNQEFLIVLSSKSSIKINQKLGSTNEIYVYSKNEVLVVSDSLPEILRHVKVQIDKDWIKSYLNKSWGQEIVNNRTPYLEIIKSVPGHVLSVNNGEILVNLSWDFIKSEGAFEAKCEDLKLSMLNAILTEKDEQLAANLSGGLDSSVINGLLKTQGKNIKSLYFEYPAGIGEEKEYAQEMARYADLDLAVIAYNKDQLDQTKAIIKATGLPIMTLVNTGSFIQMAEFLRKNDISTIYTGEGGDAIIGFGNEYLEEMVESGDLKKFELAFETYTRHRSVNHNFNHKIQLLKSALLNIKSPKKKVIFMLKTWHIHNGRLLKSIFKRRQEKYFIDKNAVLGSVFTNYNYYAAVSQSKIYKHLNIKCIHPFWSSATIENALRFTSKEKFYDGHYRGPLREIAKEILPENIRLRTSKGNYSGALDLQVQDLWKDANAILGATHSLWEIVRKENFNKILTKSNRNLDQNNLLLKIITLGLLLEEFPAIKLEN